MQIPIGCSLHVSEMPISWVLHLWAIWKGPQLSKFKQPIKSFEEFQATVKASSGLFQRDALKMLYPFFTEGNSSASQSFKVTHSISVGDHHHHHLWHDIHAGASAAIRSVRVEFDAKPVSTEVQCYLDGLLSGRQRTELMVSIKGTHWPLHSHLVAKAPKCLSLIKITHLYTKDLQWISPLIGSQPTMATQTINSDLQFTMR
jgi:hypothetical protein